MRKRDYEREYAQQIAKYDYVRVWLLRETAEKFRSKVKNEGKTITDILRVAIEEYLKK